MAASSWWVSSGGHSTTRLIPTSSTDHRDGAISSIMTFLLLLSVFLLLSCVLFLMVLFSWAASTSIAQGTVCNQHQRKTAKSTILCPCNVPWGMHTYVYFLFCVLSQFSPCGTVFTNTDTNTASDCRSIYMMSEKKTSYLDSIGAPRHALCPAMMSALPLLYQLLFLLDHKSDLSLLRVWWSIPFSLHLQHVSQLPQDFVKSSIISLLSQNY